MFKNRSIHISGASPVLLVSIIIALALLAATVFIILNPAVGSIPISRSPSSAAIQPALSQAQAAEAARLQGLAEEYARNSHSAYWLHPYTNLTRAQAAEAARLEGLAGLSINLYGSTSWLRAPALTRAQAAEAARWTGLAGKSVNLYGSTAVTRAAVADTGLTRGQAAEAARLTAQAAAYGLKPGLTHVQAVEAARWTAMSIAYGKAPKTMTARIANLIGQ